MTRADLHSTDLPANLGDDDGGADDLDAAWDWEAEIDRRVDEIEGGEDEGVSAKEVFARYGLTF